MDSPGVVVTRRARASISPVRSLSRPVNRYTSGLPCRSSCQDSAVWPPGPNARSGYFDGAPSSVVRRTAPRARRLRPGDVDLAGASGRFRVEHHPGDTGLVQRRVEVPRRLAGRAETHGRRARPPVGLPPSGEDRLPAVVFRSESTRRRPRSRRSGSPGCACRCRTRAPTGSCRRGPTCPASRSAVPCSDWSYHATTRSSPRRSMLASYESSGPLVRRRSGPAGWPLRSSIRT